MSTQPAARPARFTLESLRNARAAGAKVAMLTCYDFTMARFMHEAGIPAVLVGDSASSVILGHPTTLPVPLSFMIEITAAVRRGAPDCLLVADMPFGSYQASEDAALRAMFRMVKSSGCDCVKLEVAASHMGLIRRATDAGVAVMAHIGLRPQTVAVLGGFKTQARSAASAADVVDLARQCESAGAVALLVEAVPAEVGKAIVEATGVPVIGCGAGPHVHGHVVVTHDALGLTPRAPRFVPRLADHGQALSEALRLYRQAVESHTYPGPEHVYAMSDSELEAFRGVRK